MVMQINVNVQPKVASLAQEATNFYKIPYGGQSAKIQGTRGSLLTLPNTTKNDEDKQLIACSGPSGTSSITSFWKDLVLEKQAKVVVNLCEDVGNRSYYSECDQYWPTPQMQTYECDTVRVTLIEANQVCETLVENKLRVALYNERKSRVIKTSDITLYHFSGWPDLDTPTTSEQLAGFYSLIQALITFYISEEGENKRAVMHCRGGHGRTGTCSLILTRILQQFYETSGQISLSNTLVNLRQQRNYLCETTEQYKFAQEVVSSEETQALIQQLKQQ